jgi:hypothetical protein
MSVPLQVLVGLLEIIGIIVAPFLIVYFINKFGPK